MFFKSSFQRSNNYVGKVPIHHLQINGFMRIGGVSVYNSFFLAECMSSDSYVGPQKSIALQKADHLLDLKMGK